MASGVRPTDDKSPQGEDMNCEKSSLYLVIDGKEFSESYYQKHFRKENTELKTEIAGISKPANENSKDVIVEVETIKAEVDMTDDLKLKASRMISDTTTITLSGPYLLKIVEIISLFMEHDPFLMGRGLHVDDSTTNVTTGMNSKVIELEQGSVKVSGPFRLVKYLRKRIHQTLVQYIAIKDSPQGESIFKIAKTMAEESDGLDGGSDQPTLNEMDSKSTSSSAKWEGEHHGANTDCHKSDTGTSVDDPPHNVSVAVQTDTTTQEAAVATGNEGFKGTISETFNEGNVNRGFHPDASIDHRNSNVRTSIDDTSVAAQTDTTTPKATVLTGKESSKGAVSEATSEEPDVVEIPLEKTHRRLVVKKGRFLYEDADIKIAAICSEMGFTKGLNKNLNDQLKGQLQQTVNRRYKNGRPDKFDVFTVHCPPSTIGCRYLVVANILDRTLGSRQDHHKFLQQILHSVFKEADTLEMPTVAIATESFVNWGFPEDTILPSFVRTLNQYQFTNDEFFGDVRMLATSAENFIHSKAVAERYLGRSLTSYHASRKKTDSDLPSSGHDNVHLSSQEIIDKNKQRGVQKLADTSNLDPAVVKLMDRCQMIDKQSLRIHSDFTRVDALEGAEQKLEEFSTSYQDMFHRGGIIRESIRVREILPHNTLAMLVSTLEAQFPQTAFNPNADHNILHFLSLDLSVCSAVEKVIQDFLSKRKGTQRQPPHTEGIQEQPTITLVMPHNRSLTVKKGDLVEEEVTAIVNAANGWLKHEEGVAYAINQASRGQIQRESDQVIRDNWQRCIPTGQVAVTGAGGDLRCEAVIHAVGPDTSVMKLDDCKQLLKQVCESTLRCAEDKGMHSIALPPISSGIFAMAKDLVAQILVDTILQYPYRQNSSLKDIRIVIIDQETLMPFLRYAQQIADNSPFVSPKIATTPSSSALVPSGVTEQPTITLLMPHNRSLTVKKGDLVKEEVTAIVNAANGGLKHGAGVAYAINQASRGQVQRESDRVIRDCWQGPIPTGQVAVTGAGGDLRCKAVIHAVGPDASVMKMDDCKQLLKQACESTLHCAENEGMHSIALPPISSGIYAMPKDLVAQILIDTILQHSYWQDSTLKDIRIVIIDQLTLMPFLQYAQQIANNSPFVSPKASTTSPSSTAVPSTSQQLSFPPPPSEPDALDIPLEKTHRKMVLKKGRFLYEDADIKIAAICSELQFDRGLNKDLNDQLKGQLQQTVERRYQNGKPDKFDVFTVHCPPSTIGCRYLVVANILDRTFGKQKDHHKFLQQILHSVFKEADTLEMPSVAIVPTTFAIGGFPKDIILPSFIRMFSQYQFTNDEFLTDVRFLSATDDDFSHLIASAKRAIGKMPSQPSRVTPPEGQAQESSTANQGSWTWSFVTTVASTVKSLIPFSAGTDPIQDKSMKGDTVIAFGKNNMHSLVIKFDNLIDQDVTAIVNPANCHLEHIAGIAAAINQASNGNVQRESKYLIHRMGGPLATGRVAVTKAGGNLRCEYVIHAVGPDAQAVPMDKCQELLKQVCENILQCAEQHDMNSIALPAISSGFHAMPMDLVAQILIDTILRYSYKPDSSLKDIYIVINDREKIDAFLKCAHQIQASQTTKSATSRNDPASLSSNHPQPPLTKESSIPPKSKVIEVMEVPLENIHRKLVVKKGHFLYEDADIKIAAICSEMGYTKGLNKNLNDQLKGLLQQTVYRRYQNGKPDRFDVFTVHCPPSTIGCRYLVVANILDRTLGSRQDHHKFLQQILHSVFKEADTLEMPSVAIVPTTFVIGGFSQDSILPSFIRMFSQYQFTNDEFLTDVWFLSESEEDYSNLCAAASRVATVHTSTKSNPKPNMSLAANFRNEVQGIVPKAGRTPSVAVVTGDIVQFGADAIVVPVNTSLDMKGATSKAVNDTSGGDVLKNVSHLRGRLVEGKVFPVKCDVQWNIQADYLYLLCRSRSAKMSTLKHACRLALDTAKSHGLKSIAFPSITTHKGKDELAKSMMEVFDAFQEQNQSDMSITVVIKKDDNILHKAFMKILERSMPPLEEDGQGSEVLCTEI